MSETSRVVRPHPSALYRELQGETVLLQLDTGEYFGLDDVATRMWQLIVELEDLSQVEATLVAEYDVAPAELAMDLTRLVDDLADRQLLIRN